MLSLVTAALFTGYLLVYAAVANGGKFATEPWQALRKDAYTGELPGSPADAAAAAKKHASSGSSSWGILGSIVTTPLRIFADPFGLWGKLFG